MRWCPPRSPPREVPSQGREGVDPRWPPPARPPPQVGPAQRGRIDPWVSLVTIGATTCAPTGLGRRRPTPDGGRSPHLAPGRRVLMETQHFENHVSGRAVGGNDSSSAGTRQSVEKHTHRHAGQERDAIEVDGYRAPVPCRGGPQRPAEVIHRHLVDGARDHQPCQ